MIFTLELRSKPERFAFFLLEKISIRVLRDIRNTSYELSDVAVREYIGNADWDSKSILQYFLDKFTVMVRDDHVITVGANGYDELISNSDKKLTEIVRLIEYGVSGVPPVPRLSKVMNDMIQDHEVIYKSWEAGSF